MVKGTMHVDGTTIHLRLECRGAWVSGKSDNFVALRCKLLNKLRAKLKDNNLHWRQDEAEIV